MVTEQSLANKEKGAAAAARFEKYSLKIPKFPDGLKCPLYLLFCCVVFDGPPEVGLGTVVV